MAPNNYFQVLPNETKLALGKSAFDTFVNFSPEFVWKGRWQDLNPETQSRWLAIVESIMNQLQDLEEYVTTKMQLFNEASRVLDESVQRFESIRADDTSYNNYQLLEWLRSAHAEIINARLLMNRADIAAGNHKDEGDDDTMNVIIPNVSPSE